MATGLNRFSICFFRYEKNNSIIEIKEFIKKFADFINERMKINSYIILNDINLSVKWDGGREYFNRLKNCLTGCDCRRYHFDNSNKDKHFEYYDEYESNDLVFKIPNEIYFYNPYESCASAQMIIKKVE